MPPSWIFRNRIRPLVNSNTLKIFDKKTTLNSINQIFITGNSITKDNVIRSRLEIEPGDYIKQHYIKNLRVT